MSDSPVERLGSIHLEDMAIVALTNRADAAVPAYPDLDEDRRARLRSRIKQVSRHDWPANMQEDPLVRRGYTLRQCLRLITALMLIDAHLAPSLAIAIARANEVAFLKIMVDRIDAGPDRTAGREAEVLAVVPLGELVELVAEDEWAGAEAQRVRLIERRDMAQLWSGEHDLAHAGQRLVLDICGAAGAAWRWIEDRRLMTVAARDRLASELDGNAGNGFVPAEGLARRR